MVFRDALKSQLVEPSRTSNIILDICKKIELSKGKEKLLYEELIAELGWTMN